MATALACHVSSCQWSHSCADQCSVQVLVGDPVKMRKGDPKSLDSGTFLIRNSQRSKQLLQQIADVADQFQASTLLPHLLV